MKIGIDCRQIYDIKENQGAGIERYVFNLVKNLLRLGGEHDFVLFFRQTVSDQTIQSLRRIKNFKVIKVKNRVPFFSNHVFFTFKLWAEWLDWCLFPANIMPFLYIGKSLLVIHDIAIYTHPEWFPNTQWFSKLIVVPSSLVKATKVVAISETTKKDLLRIFKINKPEKISVVYQGLVEAKNFSPLAENEILNNFEVKRPYLFFLGTIEPRKNLIFLYKAFQRYLEESKMKIDLVIAGAKGWKDKKIFLTMQRINLALGDEKLRYLGKISDRAKEILLRNCEAFVFPSKYEGFGLPVLEAMAAGAPVITSNNSAMAEIIKDEALLIDPKNEVDLFEAIKKILNNQELRKVLIKKGLNLSRKFSWSNTARKILKIIELPENHH